MKADMVAGRCGTLLFCAVLASRAVLAQYPAEALPATKSVLQSSDWTGYYQLAQTPKALGDLKPIHPNLDQVIGDYLQPWAKLKRGAINGVAEDVGQVCLPDGLFRYPGFAGTFLWLVTPDKVVIVYGQINTAGVQRIYLNRATHPRNLLPTWNGDSIGHWDGDTLFVDTKGFNGESWLVSSMAPHTEEAHMTQRIRRVKDGAYIEILYTVEDRAALTSAYQYSRYYRKTANAMAENICAEDAATWKEFRNKALRPLVEKAKEVR